MIAWSRTKTAIRIAAAMFSAIALGAILYAVALFVMAKILPDNACYYPDGSTVGKCNQLENLALYLSMDVSIIIASLVLHEQTMALTAFPKTIFFVRQFVVGAALASFVVIAAILFGRVIGPPSAVLLRSFGGTQVVTLLLLLCVSFLVAAFEEYIFRKRIYELGSVILGRRTYAVLFSSIAFSIWHFPRTISEFLAHFIFGCAMSIFVIRSGRLEAAIGPHWAWNVMFGLASPPFVSGAYPQSEWRWIGLGASCLLVLVTGAWICLFPKNMGSMPILPGNSAER